MCIRDRDSNGRKRVINSLYIEAEACEQMNLKLQAKYREIQKNEIKFETFGTEGAEIILSAYGITSRVTKNAIKILEKEGIKAGMVRPITLWPFPYKEFEKRCV